jgi:NAD kinase
VGNDIQPRISRDSIVVVAKRSRFERESQNLNLSEEALLARYDAIGESGSRLFGSHVRQREALQICKRELSDEQVVRVEDLAKRLASGKVHAVIALGGDDFLKLASQFVKDTPVLGVNSDPSFSHGVLLSTHIDQIQQVICALESGHYRIEPWARIQLTIDGHELSPALNDVVLGKRDFRQMSRHELEFRGERIIQRSSGILVASGAGSTGWFSSAGLYLGREDRSFPREAPYLRFELREPQVRIATEDGIRSVSLPPHTEGTLLPGESLRITSLNDDDGIASRDSIDTIPFQRGAVAEISLSSTPLNMIIPENGRCYQ